MIQPSVTRWTIAEHAGVVEEARHAARIDRHRQARQRKRDVRDPEVEDRQQTGRQLRARGRGHARLTQRAGG